MNNIIMAGQAAEGSGAITGWRGQSYLTLGSIVELLESAGLPTSWAPTAKSAKAHAGQAIRNLNNLGFVVRAAKRSEQSKLQQAIGWDARWVVSRAMASTGGVGDAMGEIVLTVELHDGALKLAGAPLLMIQVQGAYDELRNAEAFAAGDVTTWLASLLITHCGATGFGTGYYIPQGQRSIASKLIAAVCCRWGRSWIFPLLPVATTDELRQGISRNLIEDITSISDSLASLRATATKENRAEIQPGQAAALLRNLKAIQERVAAYRELCGDALIAPAVLSITLLHETLSKLTDDTSVRFSLLDLDGPASAPVAKTVSPAERAAEKAASLKRATTGGLADALRAVTTATELAALLPELRKVPEGKVKTSLRDLYRAAQNRLVAPKPAESTLSPDIGARQLELD